MRCVRLNVLMVAKGNCRENHCSIDGRKVMVAVYSRFVLNKSRFVLDKARLGRGVEVLAGSLPTIIGQEMAR